MDTISILSEINNPVRWQYFDPSIWTFKVFCAFHSLTSHVGLLPLYEAGQLVTHSFVQSAWYLEQREWSLGGKWFNGRKRFVDEITLRKLAVFFDSSLTSSFSLEPLHKCLGQHVLYFILQLNLSDLFTQQCVTAPLNVKAQTKKANTGLIFWKEIVKRSVDYLV